MIVGPGREFELVIQFPLGGDDLAGFDAIAGFEEALEDWLASDSDVDGHDVGSGEMNVFVHTDDPVTTLQLIQLLLERTGLGAAEYRAGFRRFGEDRFTPAWPAELESFRVV